MPKYNITFSVTVKGQYSVDVEGIDENDALEKAYDKYDNEDIEHLVGDDPFIEDTNVKIVEIKAPCSM